MIGGRSRGSRDEGGLRNWGGVCVNLVSFVRVHVCVCWRGRESWGRGEKRQGGSAGL